MNTKPVFASSGDVFSWLGQFINLERGQTRKSFQLERMQILADLAGHPERTAPVIHVAGSKGKGSVCTMIASVLGAAGKKTAKYMSPHVSDYRERITINGNYFDEPVYLDAGYELVETLEKLMDHLKLYQGFDPSTDGEEPTFFELLTLYFFLCARTAQADVMVLETGMGGRLDATNIVDPLVSVITIIELEHQEYLGNSLGEIAREKAGIIKNSRPVILAAQDSEALDVFVNTAVSRDAPLFYLPNLIDIRDVKVDVRSTRFILEDKEDKSLLHITVPIPGRVQAENAALTYLAIKKAFPSISNEIIARGIYGIRMTGRFERLLDDPVLIIDGAHTKRSMDLCTGTFSDLYGTGGILVFGCAAGKDLRSMAEIVLPRFRVIVITTPGTFKKSDPRFIYDTFIALSSGNPVPEIILIEDTAEAVRYALDAAGEKHLPILGTGSFYLAAEIKNNEDVLLLQGNQHTPS